MNETEKDVLCALLQGLLAQALIPQALHDRARAAVLAASDEPANFFAGAEDCDGYPEDPR